jgi:signal transduction histidine kinase
MQKMQKEDEINGWIEKCGLPINIISGETFADAGFTIEDLERIRNGFDNDSVTDMLQWLDNLLISQKILKDLEESSTRIFTLVGAIKSHVHMDKSHDLEPTNIQRDIENTLTLIGYKLREKNIKVNKLFTENMPELPAYISELNQVWTNVIDNAIYAIPENGELIIETSFDSKNICVKIIDNGPGIPEEIMSRIFDPFFTTKKVGEGTGIGLDLVNRIIKHHNGEIKVESIPGRTEFAVSIPFHN